MTSSDEPRSHDPGMGSRIGPLDPSLRPAPVGYARLCREMARTTMKNTSKNRINTMRSTTAD